MSMSAAEPRFRRARVQLVLGTALRISGLACLSSAFAVGLEVRVADHLICIVHNGFRAITRFKEEHERLLGRSRLHLSLQ